MGLKIVIQYGIFIKSCLLIATFFDPSTLVCAQSLILVFNSGMCQPVAGVCLVFLKIDFVWEVSLRACVCVFRQSY